MFTIVLAFNHMKKLLSFLVFHCGSLAASKPSKITTVDGLKEVVHLFLTLVSWSTPAEAGIVACYDGTTYLVPTDEKGEQHMFATVDQVLRDQKAPDWKQPGGRDTQNDGGGMQRQRQVRRDNRLGLWGNRGKERLLYRR